MLCLSLAQTRTADAVGVLKTYQRVADLFEVRADRLVDFNLSALLAAGKKKLMVTDLSGQQTEALRAAMDAGVPYLCAPPEQIATLVGDKPKKTTLIAAVHLEEKFPSDLAHLVDTALASGADVAKIVVRADCVGDNFTMLDYLRSETRPMIGFCSGELGTISRILAVPYGSMMTFACDESGEKTAEGQLPITQMRSVYDCSRLTPGFSLYGVAGNPVAQSRGPMLFNRLFAEQKRNALYLPFLAHDASELIATARRAGISGLSVTLPHKTAIYDHLDGVDTTAAHAGAVNTVVNHNGNLEGHNTDQAAALGLIPTDLSRIRLTLLGAGGAAHAVADGLVQRGATVTICSRTAERAERLAESVGANWLRWEERESLETDFWLNATPVGMVPHETESPIGPGILRGVETVFDMVYNPEETVLLQHAWKTGCTVIRGLDMFLEQAAEQYRLWFNEKPSLEAMRAVLETAS